MNLPLLSNTNNEKRLLTVTRTGEFSQPIRLYYRISKQKTVLGAFKKLRCVYYEKPLKRWRWMYEHEAKKIHFDIPYSKIPKEHRPIILGDFFFPNETEMVIDLRSFQRATEAILFFDRRINRRVATLERVRLVNQLFDANQPDTEELLAAPYDHFFANRDDIYIPDIAKMEADMDAITAQYPDDWDQRSEALTAYLEENTPAKSPLLEELPANFYEDGIDSLAIALAMRTMEAKAHWDGNDAFTKQDVVEQFAAWMADELDDEEIDEAVEELGELTVDVQSEAVTEEEE
ncbi:hypothetical protein PN441_08665 [Spirulina major CS-329]|uniref:hypothetical protein n=1 Tax=Spirulina TaxID=1154 RepID=UPI00232F8A9C|nr:MULTISPECIES: hypothetical protein [Spirulina]MDB9494754.1 hypothetical protein [Spirulina subsalsa CS-330]MDB9503143.1 hypothetical protein [Spirulina major CS-329]